MKRVSPGFSGNCTPGFLKDSWFKSFYLTNIFVIIAIGGIGNLLTIVSVCCVFLKNPSTRLKYPWIKNPLIILLSDSRDQNHFVDSRDRISVSSSNQNYCACV
ncbi:uncharacterized protein LOC111715981 [Eurytemora carolleeae]|uniref:uncharacterized protein LOC111715981 n=1 Tax=Eurytemora carolleeae TaxID=1294199 RepID=UPI000C762765|nr:uncharacterized protein LOC111715981 [Eurytemora carolleeae]|eukprot:XP_023347156.1 uncharacterized protein LOC111715981 [Eurytemora affinis]